MKNVTQADIARSLGVSSATVALVVGQSNSQLRHRLKKETVRRVIEKAKELGYRPNRAAQVMRRGRTNLIVHLNCGGYSELAGRKSYHIGRLIHEAGFDYQVVDSYWWPGEGSRIVERIFSFQPEGIIFSGALQTEVDFSPFLASGIPLVGLNQQIAGCPWVRYDAQGAIAEMASHCIRQERWPVLLLKGEGANMNWQTQARQKGYLQALHQAGIESVPDWEVGNRPTGWSPEHPAIIRDLENAQLFNPFEAGERVAQWLLDQNCLPQALICTNDFYAIGVMGVLADAGIKIPDDVSVTGFDNLMYSAQKAVSLTTVEQPVEAMCADAVELLKNEIGTPLRHVNPSQGKIHPCRIHWRKSLPNGQPPLPPPQANNKLLAA